MSANTFPHGAPTSHSALGNSAVRSSALGLRFWLSPLGAIHAAYHVASRIARGRTIRACSWERLTALHVGEAGAVIVALPNGYAVHQTCARGLGALVARIYLIEPAPPPYDGTRASWKARQRWAQARAQQLKAVSRYA